MNTTKPDRKRIIGYMVVVICCFMMGVFIAIDSLNDSIEKILKYFLTIDNIIYFFIMSVEYLMFLLQYVMRYKSKQCTNLANIIFVQILLIIINVLYGLKTSGPNPWITLLVSAISLVGVVCYHNLSDVSLNIVRFELVWPSIYIVAISTYSGYYFVLCSVQKNSSYDILVSYGIFLFYTVIVFLSGGSDKENAKHFKKWHEYKRTNKSIWFIHLPVVFLMLILLSRGKESAVITFLCICICSVMTVFEAWDVILRKDKQSRIKYEQVLGLVMCLIFLLSTGILTISDRISEWYTIVIIGTLLVANFITFVLGEKNYFLIDGNEESIQDASKKLDVLKICSYIIMSILVMKPGLDRFIHMPNIFVKIMDTLAFVPSKRIEEWETMDINLVLSIVGLIATLISLFFPKSSKKHKQDKQDIGKIFLNTFSNKWILSWFGVCCCIGIVYCLDIYARRNATIICNKKIAILSILLPTAAIIYAFLQCIRLNKNDEKDDINKSHDEDEQFDDNTKKDFLNLTIKLLQMLHLPSCVLLTLLLMIPSLQYGNSVLISFMVAAPFVLAAMGSFALNDYFDYEKDKINKPDRILPLGMIQRKTAKKIGIGILFFSLVIAAFAAENYMELAMYWLTSLLSALYSKFIKQISPIKTFYTAAVLSVPFVFSALRWGHISTIWVYALGVFFFVTGKEILMDIFDYEGDKEAGMKTLAILVGEKVTFRIAMICHICSFICFLCVYGNTGAPLIYWGFIVAILCYLCWSTGKRKIQRITVYSFWIPLILCTVQGWLL